jgi:Protein tyrosine and serine/threonine kinase
MLCYVCSVDERLRVKVTDSALARDLFPDDYHCLGDNENRPIRWMAMETLVHRKFSPASDVVRKRLENIGYATCCTFAWCTLHNLVFLYQF